MYYANIKDYNGNLVTLNLEIVNNKMVLLMHLVGNKKGNMLLVKEATINKDNVYLEVEAYNHSFTKKYFSRNMEIFGDVYVSPCLLERSYEVEGLKISNDFDLIIKRKSLHK